VPDITILNVYIFSLMFKTKFFTNAVVLLCSLELYETRGKIAVVTITGKWKMDFQLVRCH